MAITSNYSFSRIEKETQDQANVLYKKILNAFIMAGEDFIINARGQMQDHAMGQYKDVTKNLRGSISYFIFFNGELVQRSAPTSVAIQLSDVQEFIKPTGFQLIGIAGMNYASYVESKGYNVISYQADICLVDLAGYLENLKLIEEGTAASIEDTFIPEDLPANFIVR
jgi:hypothetical protein